MAVPKPTSQTTASTHHKLRDGALHQTQKNKTTPQEQTAPPKPARS